MRVRTASSSFKSGTLLVRPVSSELTASRGPGYLDAPAPETTGQETFRSITRSYYRGAGGALLVFSIAERSSFVNCKGWLDDLRSWGEEDVVVLLVGNKGDLEGAAREVTDEEAKAWADENGLAGYVETSAKSGNGVEEVCLSSDLGGRLAADESA